jgi:hypothetical protein
MFSLETPTLVTKTRRATRDPISPGPWGRSLPPSRKPLGLPMGPAFDEPMQGRSQRKDEDSTGELRCQAAAQNALCNQAPMQGGQRFVHSREPGVRT